MENMWCSEAVDPWFALLTPTFSFWCLHRHQNPYLWCPTMAGAFILSIRRRRKQLVGKRKCCSTFLSHHMSLVPSPPLVVFLVLALAQLTGSMPETAEWLWAWLPIHTSPRSTCSLAQLILMCRHCWGNSGWRATRLSPKARVPWEPASRARVLMLSDLFKSRVTALLLECEVRERREKVWVALRASVPIFRHPT